MNKKPRQIVQTFAELVERAPFGIYIVDSEFRIAHMNAASQTGAFHNVKPAIGRDFSEAMRILWPVSVAAEIIERFRQTLDTGEPYCSAAFTEPRADIRETESYEWELHRITLPSGEYGVVCYYYDSTKLQAAETALRDKEAELDLIISRTALLLTRCSRDCRYLFVNHSYAQFLRRPAAEVIGRTIAEVMGQAAFDVIKPHIERVLRGEQAEFETEVPYAPVGRRFMRALYSPDLDERGEVIGWIATISDITERKQMERERDERAAELALALGKRTEAERRLREADRRKDEFLATLAHELRNPLAPISNALELMRMAESDGPLIQETREMMERQVAQLIRLVDDLLDVSRIGKGKLHLRKELVELSRVLNTAVESCRPVISTAAHELTIDLPKQPLYVQADPVRLAQVFLNLLNNAAKYTEKAGHIWLTAERRGDEAVISVRDTGVGIDSDHLAHVFEMFSQVDSVLERSQGGLGIGLSLAKGLVELHGGTIEAHSAGRGKGSEFTVHLPIMVVPIEGSDEPEEGQKARSDCQRRVLVVDDLRDAADSLSMLLRRMGHETRVAHDGLEAVQTAAAFQPDIVFLDIGLPKMNGYEAARHIRNESWGSGIVLIALTGWGQTEDKLCAMEAGFDHHLTKPVLPAALEELLLHISSARSKIGADYHPVILSAEELEDKVGNGVTDVVNRAIGK